MRVTLRIKSTLKQWEPPFTQEVEEHEIEAGAGQSFEDIGGALGHVFRLVRVEKDRVQVAYSSQFTLKDAFNPSDQKTWIPLNESKSFTYLWGDNGLTKTLTLTRVEESIYADAPQQSSNEVAGERAQTSQEPAAGPGF